jgi:glycine cleavage system regulatory protein
MNVLNIRYVQKINVNMSMLTIQMFFYAFCDEFDVQNNFIKSLKLYFNLKF